MEERKSLVEEMEGLTNMEIMTKRERSKKRKTERNIIGKEGKIRTYKQNWMN